jgi:hypothetical protein
MLGLDPQGILAKIVQIAPSLHRAGTFSPAALEAIARHAAVRPIRHSMETGSGASTLLLSHASRNHTVFALDGGTGSISGVKASPLLRREVVTFVEGPTQLTLPAHVFSAGLQLALIDGPHAYPFPDLEYYYIYPHLEPGAVLIVDDIHIPTITNLFDFLRVDDMFEFEEVVGTTAFFRRTGQPIFSPTGDNWPAQRYNGKAFESVDAKLMTLPAPERVDLPFAFHLDQFGPLSDPLRLAQLNVPHDANLVASGWAIDQHHHQPAMAIDLMLDGVAYRTPTRVPRPDVAAAYGDSAYFRCGFNVQFRPGEVEMGPHDLEIRVILSGGQQYCVATRFRFAAT